MTHGCRCHYGPHGDVQSDPRDDSIREAVEVIYDLILAPSPPSASVVVQAKQWVRDLYTKLPRLCVCHLGSVCGEACQTRHHTGCGYETIR